MRPSATALVLLALPLLAAGCALRPRPAEPARPAAPDRARDLAVPGPAAPADEDYVARGALRPSGAAAYDTLDARRAGFLRAETPQQRGELERLAAAGAYLGDSALVLRLRPEPGRPATVDASAPLEVGAAYHTELLLRVDGPGRAPTLRLEHASPQGPPAPNERGAGGADGGRRAPSAYAVELLDDNGGGYDRIRLLLGNGRPDGWSAQEAVPLPDGLDWRGLAHRVGGVFDPNRITVTFDGVAVIEEPLYVRGDAAVPRLLATATGPTADLLVMEWVFVPEE